MALLPHVLRRSLAGELLRPRQLQMRHWIHPPSLRLPHSHLTSPHFITPGFFTTPSVTSPCSPHLVSPRGPAQPHLPAIQPTIRPCVHPPASSVHALLRLPRHGQSLPSTARRLQLASSPAVGGPDARLVRAFVHAHALEQSSPWAAEDAQVTPLICLLSCMKALYLPASS